jgi:hypothetical protein
VASEEQKGAVAQDRRVSVLGKNYGPVILSGAKNPGILRIEKMQGFFVLLRLRDRSE